MKIAIHHAKDSYSERWVSYCSENNIPFKIVDAYTNNIIDLLQDCDAFMWHHHHGSPKDILFAKQLLFALQQAGIKVFPDFNTGWHFNDKLGQKYLFEAAGIPHAAAFVFFTKEEALAWINTAAFPKVFKLRGGAGSANVKLVNTKEEAIALIAKAFGKGFSQYNALSNLKERYRKYKEGLTGFTDLLKGIARLVVPPPAAVIAGRDRGYIYFQEFIEGNDCDIRVMVVGDKAYAIKRLVRQNDFRASGSGVIMHDREQINIKAVQSAFLIAGKLKTQCIALDFVFKNNDPLVVEISFGVLMSGYDECPGYWDKSLTWYEGKFNPYGWMIDNLLNE